mgnify:CR=1 FL=1
MQLGADSAASNRARRSGRVWKVAYWMLGIILVAHLVPIAALSTYNFINYEDSLLVSQVLEKGWLSAAIWVTTNLWVRPSFFLFYTLIIDISFWFDLSLMSMQKLAIAVDYVIAIAGLAWLVRVIMPRVPVALALALSAMALLATLVSSASAANVFADNLLLAWVVTNYLPAMGAYCGALASFVLLVSRASGKLPYFLSFVFFFAWYAGAHDVNPVSGLVLIGLLAVTRIQMCRSPDATRGVGLPALNVRMVLEKNSNLVFWALGAATLVVAMLAWLHVSQPAFEVRKRTSKVMEPLESMLAGASRMADTLPDVYFLNGPLVWVFLLVAAVCARRYGLHPYLAAGNGRLILLAPVVVFFALTFVSFAGIYMQTGQMHARVLHYAGLHMIVALFCLAAMAGSSPYIRRVRLVAGRAAVTVGLAAFAVMVGQTPTYSKMYESAVGPGYRFAESLSRRQDLLEMSRGQDVRFPTFYFFLSHEGGTPVPYTPIVGMIAGSNIADQYLAALKQVYGFRDLEIIDCEKMPSARECHYIMVP